MKTNSTLIAIDKASNIIKFASWAEQEEDPKRKLDWIQEAIQYCEITKIWLEKELPF